MVDLSLVKPGMHLKVVDNFKEQDGRCFAMREMEPLQGKIVTCAQVFPKYQHDPMTRGTPSPVIIRVNEVRVWFWNGRCFDYIVELDDTPEREFAQCDISMLFSV